jgi:hypothetical protein
MQRSYQIGLRRGVSCHGLFARPLPDVMDKAAADWRFARQPGEKRQIHRFLSKQHKG